MGQTPTNQLRLRATDRACTATVVPVGVQVFIVSPLVSDVGHIDVPLPKAFVSLSWGRDAEPSFSAKETPEQLRHLMRTVFGKKMRRIDWRPGDVIRPLPPQC
jgi:hypothetical protein